MTATRVLYLVQQLPTLQNRVYRSAIEAKSCPLGDVRLIEDLRTGLVYNDAFRPELIKYDSNYNNEQATSPFFRQHLQTVAHIVARYLGRTGIVEIGCGKGFFLEMLAADGVEVIGFDPAYEGENPRVRKEHFQSRQAGPCEGLVLRHVLEHIQNPMEFLFKLKETSNAGAIYIEVPCFDWICQNRAWFDIFYEHVNYFRLSDFNRMFGRVQIAETSFGGQYLSIVADLRTLREPKFSSEDRVQFPPDFTASLVPRSMHRSAVWGAGSKGVIFALLMERRGAKPDFVIDINPAKQGQYLPATGLRVSSPSDTLKNLEDGATIFVMNRNYLAEIREMSLNRFEYVPVDESV
jgi:SAM-dependent methyltransferase